jgi:DNA-binding CsgD family transcriptional regulator/N-acetylneuraminic acid mutarotase
MTVDNELSEREIEILKLVATGASNKEIAQILTISPNTVKVHLRNVFSKIGVVSRTEATLYAIKIGLIQPEGVTAEAPATPESNPEIPAQTVASPLSSQFRWIGMGVIIIVLTAIILQFTVFNRSSTGEPAAGELNRWESAAALPQALAAAAVEQYEGNIYLISGQATDTLSAQVFQYSINSDGWNQLADKPTPVKSASAGLLGEEIFVPGGETQDGQPTAVLEIFDIRADAWRSGAQLPEPLSRYALAAFEGNLYLFGGWNGKSVSQKVYAYDPAEDTWRVQTSLPVPVENSAAAAVSGKIYLIGGDDGQQAADSVWAYYPNRGDNDESAWVEKPALPAARSGLKAAVLNNSIYISGGEQNENSQSESILRFNEIDNQWEELSASIQLPQTGISVVAADTKIHFLGGISDGQPVTLHESYQAVYTVRLPAVSK